MVSPSQFNPNLPEHIEKALLKAMAKDRDDRYASIADFMNALHAMPTSQARMFTIPQEVRLTERTSELLKFDVKATEVEQVRTKPLNNIQVTDSEQTPVRLSSHVDNKYVPHEPDGTVMGLTANIGLGSVAGIRNAGSSFENGNADSHALSSLNIGSQAVQNISPNGSPILAGQPSKTRDLNDIQSKAGPGPGTIPFPATLSSSKNEPTGEATAVPIIASASTAKPNGSSAVPPTKGGNTGNRAVHDAGVVAAIAYRSASNVGLPPSGGNPNSPGGPNRRIRLLVAILLIVITLMLVMGISLIAVPGLLNSLAGIVHGISTTSTGTITPDNKDESNIYQIIGVTSKPKPNMREVSARIISATSPAQSKTVTSSGSIPGTRATGPLNFLNTTTSDKSFGSVILRGASGVPVTFNGPITVPVYPGLLTITGFAVNIGSDGNIGAFDISGSCCAAGITVKNGAFSGGQDPQPNSVVQQSDIIGAASALTDSLTPGIQAALQKQVHPNEQVVPNTLRCTSAVSANHAAGDHVPNMTVIVSVTCKEEVYDQQAALTLGANLLAKQASTDLGPNYALTGNIVAEVTRLTMVDTKGTLSILVRAEGVWVYQFSNPVKKDFANHIAKATNQNAIHYLMSQPGVKAVKIDNPSGNTLPDTSHITIEIVAIPGATGSPTPGKGTVTPVGPTVVPTGAATPPAKPTPTPTQGLGGS